MSIRTFFNSSKKSSVEKVTNSLSTKELADFVNGNGNPAGKVWHHDAKKGTMQLVDSDTHRRTGHYGGRFRWGG